MKARLARIEIKRKVCDEQNEKKPSLRRASTSPNDPNAQNGDDEPYSALARLTNYV